MTELQILKEWLTSQRVSWIVWVTVFCVSLLNIYEWHQAEWHLMLKCTNDPEGYYQYLPTLLDGTPFTRMGYAIELENGNRLTTFTMGVALLQLPFFLLAVGYMDLIGATGIDFYGAEFFTAIALGTCIYIASAFRFLFLVLSRATSIIPALVVLGLLFFGTNVFYYSTREPITSHMYSFFLVSALIYLTDRIKHEGVSFWLVLASVGCIGLISLIRLPNLIFAGIPAVLFTSSIKEVEERIRGMLSQRNAIGIGLLFCCIIWGLQSAYWYTVTGHFYVNPYSYNGQEFHWSNPQLWSVLFSHQNGLFVYAPILLVPVGYTIIKALKGQAMYIYILLVFCITWYVYASWWCWWLVGFGHRGFIDLIPLLAIPSVQFGMRAYQSNRSISLILLLLFLFLSGVTHQLSKLYWWPWEGDEWTWASFTEKWLTAVDKLL